jgi:hypothetical protein
MPTYCIDFFGTEPSPKRPWKEYRPVNYRDRLDQAVAASLLFLLKSPGTHFQLLKQVPFASCRLNHRRSLNLHDHILIPFHKHSQMDKTAHMG